MATNLPYAKNFFMLARERYQIKLNRDSGMPFPWTKDTHLQTWRFTNIFREDDKTTRWFRETIRDPLSNFITDAPISDKTRIKLVESTMIFRWFNRISTGELIKHLLLDEWDTKKAHEILKDVHPVVTGAFMIKTHNDMNKLDGILLSIDNARPQLPRMVNRWKLIEDECVARGYPRQSSLEEAWKDLKTIEYLGGFMAHEIVQDLRYTPILENATDIMTWGNLGPGAIRGMSWVTQGNEWGFGNSATQQRQMLALMAELLEMSRSSEYWPSEWPKWEMHQVEFLLCEFSKYMKAYSGIPQKRRYQR